MAGPPGRSFVQIQRRHRFACAIDASLGLWWWGTNRNNVIDPGAALYFASPTQIGTALWDHGEAGGDHVCAIGSGALSCWGANQSLQVEPGGGIVSAPRAITVAGVKVVDRGLARRDQHLRDRR